jgi:3-amino-4-hydroxybenzoic acid synthase
MEDRMGKSLDKRVIWFDARDLANEELLQLIYSLRFEYLLIQNHQIHNPNLKPPVKMKLIVEVSEFRQLQELPNGVIVLSGNPELLQQAKREEFKTAFYQKIESQENMDLAWQLGAKSDYVVVELTHETNIPLELIIARLQGGDTVLLKLVRSLQEAGITFGVMQVGSDGVVFKSEVSEEILKMDQFIQREEIGNIELKKAKVIGIEHMGMGYRSCIDTTNLMQPHEGMIVGSTSEGGLLISSETHFLPDMELRPFRVNAGAVHSYVWVPGGNTAYLTELKAGSRVLCVNTHGDTREVSVGRVKTELRPLLKIEAEIEGKKINTIVQDDWHIRIFDGDGQVRNATTIKIGDFLLAYTCSSGHHVGIKIAEDLKEQ